MKKRVITWTLIIALICAAISDGSAMSVYAAEKSADVGNSIYEESPANDETPNEEEDTPCEETGAEESDDGSEDAAADRSDSDDTGNDGDSESGGEGTDESESEDSDSQDEADSEPGEENTEETEELSEEAESELVEEDIIKTVADIEDIEDGEDDPQIGRALGLYEEGFYSDDAAACNEIDGSDIVMQQFNSVGTYYHNARFDGYEIKKGIDVSKHNGTINWSSVRSDGVEFAFIRIAYRGYGSSGSLNMDVNYEKNIREAKNAGIKVGVYIFSQAISKAEAAEEANYVMSHLGGYSLDLPIVMDYEFASTGEGEIGRLHDAVADGRLDRNKMTDICNTFCNTVKNAGHKAALYGNKYMFNTYIYADRISNNHKIWLANYTSKTDYKGDYTFWQCSSKERVKGIAGNVDLDFWYVGPKTYSITYSGNGATGGSVKKQSELLPGADITLRSNKFTRKGYNFAGWNTKADGSGTWYKPGENVAALSSKGGVTIKLYAQWNIISYTISYNLNYTGAVDTTGNPVSYDVRTKTFKLKKPVRTGYTFKGWYTNAKCTKKISQIKKGTTGNKTLYAKWAVNKYKIIYYGNGAKSGKVKGQTCKYGQTYSIRDNKFTRKGYKFVGWATTKNGLPNPAYAPRTPISNLRTKDGAKVKFYACWDIINYTITYNMGYEPETEEGAEVPPVEPDNGGNPDSYNIRTTITLKTPVREGYVFKGWYADPQFKKKVTKIKKGSTGNKNLYALWAIE